MKINKFHLKNIFPRFTHLIKLSSNMSENAFEFSLFHTFEQE